MKITHPEVKGTWREVANAARTTIGKKAGDKEPTGSWKKRMLLAEHSPIRKLLISWKWLNIPYWVSVHFVRHKFGIEHWVRTQRTDRTKTNRNTLPQDNPVEHEVEANVQAIINISRKRLCRQASPETRAAWWMAIARLGYTEPEIAQACVPDCIYRGWCYEYESCGYYLSSGFKEQLNIYRKGINKWEEFVCK